MGEDRSATGRKRVFHLLDGIRGIAALVIVQRHTAWLFGMDAWPGTYLGVDLFFVLSGFVIAHSYEHRLAAGWSWRSFMTARLIRLYPLYLLGILLGMIALAGRMVQAPESQGGASVFLQAVFSATLMLPNWGLPPLIGARWSLTYELISNALYALIVPVLTDRLLLAIIAGGGAALVLLMAAGTPVDSGWEYNQAPMALARVGYSFFVGLLLYRIHKASAALPTLLLFAAIVAALWIGTWMLAPGAGSLAKATLILVGFPALTLVAASFDVGGTAAKVCGFLGTISYAVYVLHQPAALLFEAALRRLVGAHAVIAPYAGWLFLALLVVGCRILDSVYDKRVRARLLAWAGRP